MPLSDKHPGEGGTQMFIMYYYTDNLLMVNRKIIKFLKIMPREGLELST